jgi:hypothetical protein
VPCRSRATGILPAFEGGAALPGKLPQALLSRTRVLPSARQQSPRPVH